MSLTPRWSRPRAPAVSAPLARGSGVSRAAPVVLGRALDDPDPGNGGRAPMAAVAVDPSLMDRFQPWVPPGLTVQAGMS